MQQLQVHVPDQWTGRYDYTLTLDRSNSIPVSLTPKSIVAIKKYHFEISMRCHWGKGNSSYRFGIAEKLNAASGIERVVEIINEDRFGRAMSNLREAGSIKYNQGKVELTLPPRSSLFCDNLSVLQAMGLDVYAEDTLKNAVESAELPSQAKRGKVDGHKIVNRSSTESRMVGVVDQSIEIKDWPDRIIIGVELEGTFETYMKTVPFALEEGSMERIASMIAETLSYLPFSHNLKNFLSCHYNKEENNIAIKGKLEEDRSAVKVEVMLGGPGIDLIDGPHTWTFEHESSYTISPSSSPKTGGSQDLLSSKRPLTMYAEGIRLGMDAPNNAIGHVDQQGTIHFVNTIISDRRNQSFILVLRDACNEKIKLENATLCVNFLMNYIDGY